MTDRLAIDEKNQLKEIAVSDAPAQPALIKGLGNFFSYIFHPLFIPVYITLFLLKVHPQVFAGLDDWGKLGNLLQVFVNCTFLPLVTVLLLKGLKFIDSVFLRTQKDRIIPYIICMIYFFNCWYAFRNNHGARELESMSMAVFNACVFGFLANIFLKVSMHAIAVGVMSTFITLLAFNESTNQTLYLSIAILITGIVCTSRLIVSDHSTKEIYSGLVIGIFSQLAANYFVS
jgi:hypothetical protein